MQNEELEANVITDDSKNVANALREAKIRRLQQQERFEVARLKDDDARRDSQRYMVWLALFGLLSYPLTILVADFSGLSRSAELISSMAPTYFLSVAGIVSTFFVVEKKNTQK